MRLLDTKTGRFCSFEDPRKVRYAILSHVWSKDSEEMTYQEVQNLSSGSDSGDDPIKHPSFSVKIRSFCETARDLGFNFGWADSCCIDKTSSSELSKSITSMYDWYRHSDICLAYLYDVKVGQDEDPTRRNPALCNSVWFRRGWTLQELLAPPILLFFSKTWKMIGSKQTSAAHISSVTKIDQGVLRFERSLDEISVARRMSWAASRRTSQVEDEAYCLMGIFGVSIPVIYGEGQYAFIRLQEEIIRTIPDQSIFAWGPVFYQASKHPYHFQSPFDPAVTSTPNPPSSVSRNSYLLASSPRDFLHSSGIIHFPPNEFAPMLDIPLDSAYQAFVATAHGIRVSLPLVGIVPKDHDHGFPKCLAILACGERPFGDGLGNLLALYLHPQAEDSERKFTVCTVARNPGASKSRSDLHTTSPNYRTAYLSPQDVGRSWKFVKMVDIYLPHRHLRMVNEMEVPHEFRILRDPQEDKHIEIFLSGWSQTLLSRANGYELELKDKQANTYVTQDSRLIPQLPPWITINIKPQEVPVKIQVGYCTCGAHPPGMSQSRTVGILGVLVWSVDPQPKLSADVESASIASWREQFEEGTHPAVHLHSWAIHGGVASTTVKLRLKRPSSLDQALRVTIHLTLNPRPPVVDQGSRFSTTLQYELGVEVTSFTAPETVQPSKKRMRPDDSSDNEATVPKPIFNGPGSPRNQAPVSTPSRVRPVAASSYNSSPGDNPSAMSRRGTNIPVTAANSRTDYGAMTDSGWDSDLPQDYSPEEPQAALGSQFHPSTQKSFQRSLPTHSQRPPEGLPLYTRESFDDVGPGSASGSEASPGRRPRGTDQRLGPHSSFRAHSASNRHQDMHQIAHGQMEVEGPMDSTVDFWQRPGQPAASYNEYSEASGGQPPAQVTAPDVVPRQHLYDTPSLRSLQAPFGGSGVSTMNPGGSRNSPWPDEDASRPATDGVRYLTESLTSQLGAGRRGGAQSMESTTAKPGVAVAGQGEQRRQDETQAEKSQKRRWFNLKPSEWFKPFKRNSTKTS